MALFGAAFKEIQFLFLALFELFRVLVRVLLAKNGNFHYESLPHSVKQSWIVMKL